MNKILKYILYFLFGFILIYFLFKNKIIEGLDNNDFSLLYAIMKERKEIGCSNYICEEDPYYINTFSLWRNKVNIKDENSYLCNNAPRNSILSTLDNNVRCNKELCCEDRSCNHTFFNKGNHCVNRVELHYNECPVGVESSDCQQYCCGIKLEGAGRIMYNSIRRFKEQIHSNSSENCDHFYNLYNPNNNIDTISLLDFRNYQYFNTLDLEYMKQNNASIREINTTIDTISYCDFENIQTYLTELYNQIKGNAITFNEIINNFKTSVINDNLIKIKNNFVNDEMNISEYVNRLTDNSANDLGSIFSEEIYGLLSKEQIQDKYTNFLTNYTEYNEQTNNTHELLIKSIKLTMILLGNSILDVSDDRTPMDLLLGLEEKNDYYNSNISSSDLQIIL